MKVKLEYVGNILEKESVKGRRRVWELRSAGANWKAAGQGLLWPHWPEMVCS